MTHIIAKFLNKMSIFNFSVDQSAKQRVNKTPFMAAPMCPHHSRRHPRCFLEVRRGETDRNMGPSRNKSLLYHSRIVISINFSLLKESYLLNSNRFTMLKIEINKFISISTFRNGVMGRPKKKHKIKFSYRALFISYQVRF